MATPGRLRQARRKLDSAPSQGISTRNQRSRRSSPRKDSYSYVQQEQSQRLKLTETNTEAASHAAEKLRAMRAAMMVLWVVLPTYAFQFFFWLFGLAAIALETIPGLNFVLPGSETYLVSYGIIALIGILSMLYAAFVFTVKRVRWFGGSRGLAFAFCTALYLVFFLNLFPWVILWMLLVIFARREGEAH